MEKKSILEKKKSLDYLDWWNDLENQWKMAFNQAVLQKGEILDAPTQLELEDIRTAMVYRFAGPKSAFPNMSFELTNLSGIKGLSNLEILIVMDHQIEDLTPLTELIQLKTLYANYNQISSLKEIENLINLKELNLTGNKIDSLKHLKKLTNLETLYVNNNQLTSLDGINDAHSTKLRNLICLPNEISVQEIRQMEQTLGIRCRQG